MHLPVTGLVLFTQVLYSQAALASKAAPYDDVYGLRTDHSDPLTVDLGYGIFKGANDLVSSLKVWQGIPYAAAPLGNLRFTGPTVPGVSREAVKNATQQPVFCPQAPSPDATGLTTALASIIGGATVAPSEDCLFLNVQAPVNATNLPVFVWIHGGGYQVGQGNADPSTIMKTNNNNFVSVVIQYRLGAFGFLSSEEVKDKGALNAGMLDQQLALRWVQRYISLFGGDPSRVTIAGESAGAGSVMNHILAYGGANTSPLFENAIAASPFLPQYFKYNDAVPAMFYKQFASLAGCNSSSSFDCLQNADSKTLITANAAVALQTSPGLFAWKPVIDGDFIQQRPSDALRGSVNGKRILVGYNANEGFLFVPQTINTTTKFETYLKTYFPNLPASQTQQLLKIYTTPEKIDIFNATKYDTNGLTGATALNQSGVGAGNQQLANNFYAEVTFVCPAYWLSQAFTQECKTGYMYTFTIPPAVHGFDIFSYFPAAFLPVGATVQTVFQQAYGSFITDNKPSDWPLYALDKQTMRNLNATGGNFTDVLGLHILLDPGVQPLQQDVDAYSWEGGRGKRCEFLRQISEGLVV